MRLIELEARWVVDSSHCFYPRYGMGVGFSCPHCQQTRLVVYFANPIDGGPTYAPRDPCNPAPMPHLWQRTGETFETMSLMPSIDASASGHWHGFVTQGEIR